MASAYDIAGRRTLLTWPDSFYVNYDYLVTGEVSAVRENGATSGVGVLATYSYDNLARRTSVTRGNGTGTSYSYDGMSRLTALAENISGTSYDQTLGFSYNPASQIVQNTRSNDSFAWGGHGSGSTASTTNGLNQLTAVGSTTPTYDTRGNLTYAGSTTYGYSSENLLTSTTGGSSLTYDPATRLYQVAGGAAGTQRFAYDGAQLAAEYNGSNAMLRRYVFGPGTDEPIVWYEGSGTTDRRFLHADERHSVVAVTNSSGAALNINTYDEYGKPGASNSSRFQYTGQAWLPELGLYYYRARMYASGLGRFMQNDPIGYVDGMNTYAYVHGDPENAFDPSGLADSHGCVSGTHWEPHPTGSHIPQCVQDGSGVAGGADSNAAGEGHIGSLNGALFYVPGVPGTVTGDQNEIVVTAGSSGYFLASGGENGGIPHNTFIGPPARDEDGFRFAGELEVPLIKALKVYVNPILGKLRFYTSSVNFPGADAPGPGIIVPAGAILVYPFYCDGCSKSGPSFFVPVVPFHDRIPFDYNVSPATSVIYIYSTDVTPDGTVVTIREK